MRLPSILVLTALSQLALGSASGAATLKEEFSQTYRLSPDGQITLANTNGDVTVTSWERDEIRVEATKTVKASDNDRARELMKELRIEVSQGDDSLDIQTHLPRTSTGLLSWIFGRGFSATVSYRLTVPSGVNLGVTTVNGSVVVDAVEGKLATRTTNGGIEVTDCDGTLRARTVNGNIRADLRSVTEGADLSLHTVNGSITMSVPDSLQADLDARTVNGRVSSELSIDNQTTDRRRRRLQGELNGGGGGRLNLRTVNGSIRLASQ